MVKRISTGSPFEATFGYSRAVVDGEWIHVSGTTGYDYATMKMPDLKETDINLLEKEIDAMNEVLPPMKSFLLPGGHIAISTTHVARCVCRRAAPARPRAGAGGDLAHRNSGRPRELRTGAT